MCDNNKIDELAMYNEAPFISDGCELFMLLTFECQWLSQQFQLFPFKLSEILSNY